jgi:hypothetical protein
LPSTLAVISTVATRPAVGSSAGASSMPLTVPVSSSATPWSSSGTTTGRVKRAPKPTTADGSPVQLVTSRPASAIVSIPCAMTPGSPTEPATRSLQWIGLRSPDAAA